MWRNLISSFANSKRLPNNVVQQPLVLWPRNALAPVLAFIPAMTSATVGIFIAADAKFDGVCILGCIGLSLWPTRMIPRCMPVRILRT